LIHIPSSKAAFLLFPIQAEFNGIDNAAELNEYTVTHHLRDPAMMFGDKWHQDVAPAPPESSQRAEEAVAAYRAALTVWTRERMPLDWATSAGNQGVALLMLAERLGNARMAETTVSGWRSCAIRCVLRRTTAKGHGLLDRLSKR
jgi:hypothetical protein